MLSYDVDNYGRILPDASQFPTDPAQFQDELDSSLREWSKLGLPTIWLTLTEAQAALIPIAVSRGFSFHHTHDDQLLLVYLCKSDAFVLHYASHYLGAGGVVINAQDEILAVRQQPLQDGAKPRYTLPGGFIEVGEHISHAVMREVTEETGIQTEFESIVGFRLWHVERFGKSDIYFVCRLRPLNNTIIRQESEILEAVWMPVQTFIHHEQVSVFNRSMVKTALQSAGYAPSWFDGYHTGRPAMRQKIELFLPREK